MDVKKLFDLSGRVAIISGGATGLGRQMAEGLAEMGANLVLCARKKERCLAAAEELQKHGGQVLALGCDVKVPSSIHEVVDAAAKKFGRIDILINNAGTSWGAPAETMTLDQWNKVMISQRRGKIINIASVAGLRGSSPTLSAIGYSSSKGGVIIFTKDLACKWGVHNIQVNAIAPGWFPTDMSDKVIERNREVLLAGIPLGRFGGPDDLKGAAVFLGSDASDFVTGHTLVVDGGQSA